MHFGLFSNNNIKLVHLKYRDASGGINRSIQTYRDKVKPRTEMLTRYLLINPLKVCSQLSIFNIWSFRIIGRLAVCINTPLENCVIETGFKTHFVPKYETEIEQTSRKGNNF